MESIDKVEDLDITMYLEGISSDLKRVNLDINSRVFPEILAEALDTLVSSNKSATTSKFNRIIFSHVLDFKSLGQAQSPILVSDFFSSFFTVYESMRCNRDKFSEVCLNISKNKEDLKQQLVKSQKTEEVYENGQTNNSKIRLELKDISVFRDLSNVNLESAFIGKSLVFEYVDNSDNQANQTPHKSTEMLKVVPLNNEGLENSYQFPIENINKPITISLLDGSDKQKIDVFYPRECFDIITEKALDIPGKGKVDLEIVYINSTVNFINKLISEKEQEYEENHVHFDNLSSSISLMEEPFKSFFDRYNMDPERRLKIENNPNKNEAQGGQSYVAHMNRKEIEVSEKVENLILNVSGRKCIVWDTIYFLLNKIMLGCVILVMTYRPDYATLLIGILGAGFETNNIPLNKFGKLVFFLLISLIYDFFWVIGSLINWSETTPLEGDSLNGVRKFATIMSFVVIILKIILCFAGWRLYMVYKMREINLLNLPGPGRKTDQARFKSAIYAQQNNSKAKWSRPTITYKKRKEGEISLRFIDGGI